MGFVFSKLFSVFKGFRNNSVSRDFLSLRALGREIRILILGLDNAGKTTILYRLQSGQMIQTLPTVGLNVEELKINGLKVCRSADFVLQPCCRFKAFMLGPWRAGKYSQLLEALLPKNDSYCFCCRFG